MGEWQFQQVWIALAAEVTNLHTVGPGVICRSLSGFGVDGISAAARVTKQIPTACPGDWEGFLEKVNLSNSTSPPSGRLSAVDGESHLKRTKKEEHEESPTHRGHMEC